MCKPTAIPKEKADGAAGVKVAAGTAACVALSKLLPAASAFATKPAFGECLRHASVFFVILWFYELVARTLLGMLRNAHPVLARSRDRIVLARHSMDTLALGYLAVQGWMMWGAMGAANVPATPHARLYSYLPAFQWCAIVMLGYQAKNLMDAVIHSDGPEFIVHHVITSSVALCALHPYAHVPGIFFFGISETSTTLLCVVANFDDVHGVPSLKLHFPISKLVLGALFAVSFVCLRTGVWPYLAYHFVQDSLAVLADGTAHSAAVVWGFVGCLGVLTCLQVAWLGQMIITIHREFKSTMADIRGAKTACKSS